MLTLHLVRAATYQHGTMSMRSLFLLHTHWHQWDVQYKSMNTQISANNGRNTVDGWYPGALLEHNCCHKVYMKSEHAEWMSDSVYLKHEYITQLFIIPADIIIKT